MLNIQDENFTKEDFILTLKTIVTTLNLDLKRNS